MARSLSTHDFRFTLAPERTFDEVCERLSPAGGLAGCDVGFIPSPLRAGNWMVTIYTRSTSPAERWLPELLDILRRHFPEARYEGMDTEAPGEPGIQWVKLNGPQDGLGNRALDA